MLRGHVLESLTDENLLRTKLEEIAPVAQIRLVRRHEPAPGEGYMRDFCFVDFATTADSTKVVESSKKNGFKVLEQEVHVSFSKIKKPGF